MCFKKCRDIVLWSMILIIYYKTEKCNAITNSQFNASIRDYSVQEDNANETVVRTLQKEYERFTHLAPASTPIRFKEIPDSALSSTSHHGRGLHHDGHHGYGLVDYEESPHYVYEYHFPDDHGHYGDHHGYHGDHHDLHHLDHHHHHHNHGGYKHGYGHHPKHYDHALAAKTVLLPIAGIALLGAAAALVSNPVLLQLGVVSGKRRRRDTEDFTDRAPKFSNNYTPSHEEYTILDKLQKSNDDFIGDATKTDIREAVDKRKLFLKSVMINNHKVLLRKTKPTVKTSIQSESIDIPAHRKEDYKDKHYIPIPLKLKD